jgi:hypothetical protein
MHDEPDRPPWDMASIRQAETVMPDLTGAEIGSCVTARMSKAALREFAAEYIAGCVDAIRRARARMVEQSAAKGDDDQGRPAPQPNEKFQEWFDNPPVDGWTGNATQRAAFRKWAGARWNGWHERARGVVVDPKRLALFDDSWHPGGVWAAMADRRRARITQLVDAAVEEAETYTRLQVTAELLATTFSLGDGTYTSWGDATVADHQKRIALLTRNAAGNIDTASLHRAAIEMIEESGEMRLRDVTTLEAA